MVVYPVSLNSLIFKVMKVRKPTSTTTTIVLRAISEVTKSLFEASTEWYDFGSDNLTFGPKTCFILVSLCRTAKSLGVSPMKIQPFLTWLICKTLRLGWYCLSSLMILIGVLNFGSIPVAISGVLFL